MDWGDLIGAAARLGWPPDTFWQSTFYELTASIAGRFPQAVEHPETQDEKVARIEMMFATMPGVCRNEQPML
ncbi:phage tail assembly chaperone [Rhodomicrobium lacus]|uniref:phage tail assembly chaperone n=1 Tax=Rhodomicrobium lacus TaxID=2498452 RepID=UPI000F8E4955